jgi:Transcriptional regulator
MDMDTEALRWLQQVADGTTVTEVSELESVTQSGVSRALARLEAQVGTPLLRRSGRTLRMTHAGAVFKPHLDALLHTSTTASPPSASSSTRTPAPWRWPSSSRWAPGSSPTWPAASAPRTRASGSGSPSRATNRTS